MNTTPPTECKAWQALAHHAESWRGVHLRSLFEQDVARGVQLVAEGPGVRYDYSRQRIGAMTLRLLARLAVERGFAEWREALLAGKPINNTENRPAWHTALRASSPPAEVRATLQRAKALAARVRSEKRYRRIVNLGTGGSDLGPRLLADALGDGTLDVRFAANVDPKDLERALEGADPASTLFVVVSKTFTTQETMANAQAARHWLGSSVQDSFVAITANTQLASSFGAKEIFPMWDWVGGRFSIWSSVGFAAMCAIGPDAFEQFLEGGKEIDEHFAQAPLEKNVPVLMALVGVWNTNFLGIPTHAVLPYSNALRLLPSYLQQLEMESNGKRVDRDGRRARLCHGAGAVGRRGHGEPAFLPPAPAPGHAGQSPADFIDARRWRPSALLRRIAARRPMRSRFGTDDAACRRTGNIRATALRACCSSKNWTREPRTAVRPVRAQGLHPGRHLEHQQLRPVGRRARQAARQANPFKRRAVMDQETFNLSIRKFLKLVGVNSQREIEQAVQKSIQSGSLKGGEAVPVKCTLEIPSLGVQRAFRRRDPTKMSCMNKPREFDAAALTELRALLGDRVSTSAAVREHHGKDESYFPYAPPDAVVFCNNN